MDLYLFNPDNDLALANNDDNYRSPASARRMGFDLTPLMGWLANDGDILLFPHKDERPLPALLYPHLQTLDMETLTTEFAKDKKRWLNLKEVNGRRKDGIRTAEKKPGNAAGKFLNDITGRLYPPETLTAPDRIIPWGWNPSLIRQLGNAGLSPSLLPSPAQMRQFKSVSHRSSAVSLLRLVREKAPARFGERLCGTSMEITSEEELKHLIENSGESLLLKAPLSGSGRGLNRSMGQYAHPVSGWCRNTLQAQGSVIVEPYYNKVCDFAMEFHAGTDGEVRFKGYSLFETNPHGSYTRNLLLSDTRIVSAICTYDGITPDLLEEVRQLVQEQLHPLVSGRYHGFLGVDMMVVREKDGYKLHPCVEINARFTMGVFSRLFFDCYLPQNATGTFQLRFSNKDGALLRHVRGQSHLNPATFGSGCLTGGYFPLTPVDETTRFVAEVQLAPPDE